MNPGRMVPTLVVSWLALSAVASAGPVESFSGTGTCTASLPGTAVGSGVRFQGNLTLNTVDFAPGSMTFEGQPVDFDGKEATFLSSTYADAAISFPSTSGVVAISGAGNIAGGAINATVQYQVTNVSLGGSFNPNFFHVLTGPVGFTASTPAWSSTLIPQLNGATVSSTGSGNITSVDAANGILSLNVSGSVNAIAAVARVPTVTVWGLLLMTTGILGLGAYLLAKKPGFGRPAASA
jgi:hypothetical protein